MWPKVSFLVSSPTFCFFFRGEKSFQQATSKEYNLALLSITIILFFNRRKVASNSEEFWTLHENGNGKGCRAIQNTTDKEFQKLLKELFNNPEDIKKPLSAPWNLERKKNIRKKNLIESCGLLSKIFAENRSKRNSRFDGGGGKIMHGNRIRHWRVNESKRERLLLNYKSTISNTQLKRIRLQTIQVNLENGAKKTTMYFNNYRVVSDFSHSSLKRGYV